VSVKKLNVEINGKSVVISASSETSFIPLYAGKDLQKALQVVYDFEHTNMKKLDDQRKYLARMSLAARTQILQLIQGDNKDETINKS